MKERQEQYGQLLLLANNSLDNLTHEAHNEFAKKQSSSTIDSDCSVRAMVPTTERSD
jgi:hypothetical protein